MSAEVGWRLHEQVLQAAQDSEWSGKIQYIQNTTQNSQRGISCKDGEKVLILAQNRALYTIYNQKKKNHFNLCQTQTMLNEIICIYILDLDSNVNVNVI